jgi:PBSX family phage terminase large subunit
MITGELWEALGIPDGWSQFFPQFNKQDLIATAHNGSKIYFRSCDREGDLRGPNLGWFYIDEAARVSLNTWKIMVGRIRRPPEKGWIATTPKGRNWVWEEFAQRKRNNYEWFKGDSGENTHLSAEYKASLKESYSGSFLAQEFYGEFTAWEGLVYPDIAVEKHHLDASTDGYKYALAGCDWGWADPSVILVGLVGMDGRIHFVEEYYKNRTPIETIAAKALELRDKWGVRTYWCDPSRPEYVQEFRKWKLDARKGKNEIDPGISAVSRLIEKDLFRADFNQCPEMIREFETYQYSEDDQGKVLKDRPIDRDNHCMDAMRYLVYSQQRQGHASSRRGR